MADRRGMQNSKFSQKLGIDPLNSEPDTSARNAVQARCTSQTIKVQANPARAENFRCHHPSWTTNSRLVLDTLALMTYPGPEHCSERRD
jgi:hypothetical protein